MSYRIVIPAVALGLAVPFAAAKSETKPAAVTEPAHATAEAVNKPASPMLAVKAGERAGEAAKAMLENSEPTLKLPDVIDRAREAIKTARNADSHDDKSGKTAN